MPYPFADLDLIVCEAIAKNYLGASAGTMKDPPPCPQCNAELPARAVCFETHPGIALTKCRDCGKICAVDIVEAKD